MAVEQRDAVAAKNRLQQSGVVLHGAASYHHVSVAQTLPHQLADGLGGLFHL